MTLPLVDTVKCSRIRQEKVNFCSFEAILLTADFFYFPVLRFCPTFSMLFSMSSNTRNDHKTNCCNCFGGDLVNWSTN